MNVVYNRLMGRRLTKQRPPQGEHLLKLRKMAGISQREFARLIGEPPQNVAFWEQAEKPPRGEVIPKMAKILKVRAEDILNVEYEPTKPAGPVGKLQKVFMEASNLPRKQQDKIVEFVSAFVQQYKQNHSQNTEY